MSAQEITSVELLDLITEQRRDDEIGHRRVRHAPLEILAGLNPHALKGSYKIPRFLSGRKVRRRPQRRKGATVQHGTDAMYKRGCRCDGCRGTHSIRNKEYRARAAEAETEKPAP